MTVDYDAGCPRCFIENKPCARHCDPAACPDPAHAERTAEDGLHPCQLRPHYGEPCDCENRLAQVVTHTRTTTPLGPDFCAECSEAISEWVPWTVCARARRVFSPGSGADAE